MAAWTLLNQEFPKNNYHRRKISFFLEMKLLHKETSGKFPLLRVWLMYGRHCYAPHTGDGHEVLYEHTVTTVPPESQPELSFSFSKQFTVFSQGSRV